MRRYNFWQVCVCLMFALFGQAHAETVALVSDILGTVKTGSTVVKLLDAIPSGARIDLSAGARLTLIYIAKGEEYRLSGPGSYQVDAAIPQTISGSAPVKQASIGGVLSGKKIHAENVSQATLTMRGVRKVRRSLEPLSPSGSITLADPLQLSWREPTEGLAYQIQLIDSQNKVLISQEVTGNSFILPAEIRLSGGAYYVWNLSTTIPDGSLVTSSAQFRVATNEAREQAAKIRPAKDGTVSERVVYGLWLEAENLVNEAHQVWDQLAVEFPDQPNLFDRAARGL